MPGLEHPRWLNLELRDSTGAPLAGRPYVLILADGTRRAGALDPAGCLSEPIPAGCERLRLDVAERELELELDALAPGDSLRGAQERLNQLHYYVGSPDGALGPLTDAALRRFQRDQGLAETGELDPRTIERLLAEHGS